MDKGTFGENLKRAREMRGVSLDEISAATRIATRFLQAIENEQWDQLPGGVFNRGFVRAVAHYLGLDEENIVAEYVLAAGDRQSVPVWTGRPPAVAAEQPWLAWILAIVVILALLAGGWFGVRRISAWLAARRVARNAAVSAIPSPLTPEVPAHLIPAAVPDRATPNPIAVPKAPSGTRGSTTASTAILPAFSRGTLSVPVPFDLTHISRHSSGQGNGNRDSYGGTLGSCSAGVPPAFFYTLWRANQISGETPALQNRGGSSHSIPLLPEGDALVRNAVQILKAAPGGMNSSRLA